MNSQQSTGIPQFVIVIAAIVVALMAMKACNRNSTPLPAAAHAAPSIDQAKIRAEIASITTRPKWQAVEVGNLEPRTMRLYLVYGLPPQSMGEVKADCEAALMEAIRRTDSVGYHPDFMSIYALSRLDNGFERRYGSASYSPVDGRIQFKPAE